MGVSAHATHGELGRQYRVLVSEAVADRPHTRSGMMHAGPGAARLRQRKAKRIHVLVGIGTQYLGACRRGAENTNDRRPKPWIGVHTAGNRLRDPAHKIISKRNGRDEVSPAGCPLFLGERQSRHQGRGGWVTWRRIVSVVEVVLVHKRGVGQSCRIGWNLQSLTSNERCRGLASPRRDEGAQRRDIRSRAASDGATDRVEDAFL